jgi:multimeric flavodoxin WrbA
MKVIAICGSPRKNSNTEYLTDQALEEIGKRGLETEKFVLCRYKISPCWGHDDCWDLKECKIKDDAPGILEKYVEADAVILASPVYMFTITAFMKIFMDRTYFFYTHNRIPKARAAGLIAVGGGEGADETIREMRKLMGPCRIPIFEVKGYTGAGDDIRNRPQVVEMARKMGRDIADALS